LPELDFESSVSTNSTIPPASAHSNSKYIQVVAQTV
jgi:hypothetical protein